MALPISGLCGREDLSGAWSGVIHHRDDTVEYPFTAEIIVRGNGAIGELQLDRGDGSIMTLDIIGRFKERDLELNYNNREYRR